jgi:hypothetical protein
MTADCRMAGPFLFYQANTGVFGDLREQNVAENGKRLVRQSLAALCVPSGNRGCIVE